MTDVARIQTDRDGNQISTTLPCQIFGSVLGTISGSFVLTMNRQTPTRRTIAIMPNTEDIHPALARNRRHVLEDVESGWYLTAASATLSMYEMGTDYVFGEPATGHEIYVKKEDFKEAIRREREFIS